MTPAHLHLVLVHFPIAASFLALPLLILALIRRADGGSTSAVALVLLLGAGAAVAAKATGEEAEEVAEHLPGVSEATIHEHEERAELATVLAVLAGLGGLAAGGLALAGRTRLATAALGVTMVADLASAGAMAWTGLAGGEIRHTELRDGAAAATGAVGDGGEDEAEEHGERSVWGGRREEEEHEGGERDDD
jgi:uncharacterized membrane protein